MNSSELFWYAFPCWHQCNPAHSPTSKYPVLLDFRKWLSRLFEGGRVLERDSVLEGSETTVPNLWAMLTLCYPYKHIEDWVLDSLSSDAHDSLRVLVD